MSNRVSELQDALNVSSEVLDDGRRAVREEHLKTIVEAARRVANPDAATERILDLMGMHEHTQRDWDRAYELACAALGITTEDTESVEEYVKRRQVEDTDAD